MDIKLDGRVALITGGSKGLSLATAPSACPAWSGRK
jgi:NAD(P)-dependent dehydrogenase (short-subunit alcohol dehydrogenase family)